MQRRRFTEIIGYAVRDGVWLLTVGPFCFATDLPTLATSSFRPLVFDHDPDNYPITELLGRLLAFRSRVRFARSLILFVRVAILGGFILVAAKALQLATHEPMSGWLPVALVLLVLWSIHLALHHSISPFEVAR